MLYLIHRYNPLFDFMFEPLKDDPDVKVVEVSSHFNFLVRWFKSLCMKTGMIGKLPQKWMFHTVPFPEGIKPGDSVLLFDVTTTPMVRWIEKNASPGKVSVFFWNTVKKHKDYLSNRNNINVCTFDFGDAQKYDMTLVPQVYRHPDQKGHKLEYDFFYVGADKGRLKGVDDMMGKLQAAGFTTKCLMLSNTAKQEDYPHVEIIREFYPYRQILEFVEKSRVLIDITKDKQTGFTLRPMEGLFWNKKVITNNRSILESEFYEPSRHMVLDGTDIDMDELRKFLETPIKPVPEEKLAKHELKHWLRQFMK